MTSLNKIEGFVKEVRGTLLETIEDTHKILMDFIEQCFDANLTDIAMKGDKTRERLDAWREKFMYQNPINKIFTKIQEKDLKEKKRLRGIILLLETFMVEASFIKGEVQDARFYLKKYSDLPNTLKLLENKMDSVVQKLALFDDNLKFYEEVYNTELGIDTEKRIKEQLLQYFKKKELKKMIHYVKSDNIDKLEWKFLDETDLVDVDKLELENEGEDIEDFTSITPYRSYYSIEGIPVESKAIEGIPVEIPEVTEEEKSQILEKEKQEKSKKPKENKQKESHINNFFRKLMGGSPYDDDARGWILFKSQELVKNNENTDSVLFLYRKMVEEHPKWNLTFNHFLNLMKKMVKTGLLARLEKLDTGFYMIQFQPLTLTTMPTQVVALAKQKTGVIKVDDVMKELKWSEYQAQSVLDHLVEAGIARTDTGFILGQQYYFGVEY